MPKTIPARKTIPNLNTPGRIAETLGKPIHRVLHILKTRPHIQPSARAGNLRLYDSAAIAAIRHELNAIDARRSQASEVTP